MHLFECNRYIFRHIIFPSSVSSAVISSLMCACVALAVAAYIEEFACITFRNWNCPFSHFCGLPEQLNMYWAHCLQLKGALNWSTFVQNIACIVWWPWRSLRFWRASCAFWFGRSNSLPSSYETSLLLILWPSLFGWL